MIDFNNGDRACVNLFVYSINGEYGVPRLDADGRPEPCRRNEPAGAGEGDEGTDSDGGCGGGVPATRMPCPSPTGKSTTLVQAQDSASSYLRAAYKASASYASLRQVLTRAAAAVGFTPEGTPAPRGALLGAAEGELAAGPPQPFQCAGIVCGAGERDEARWATSFGKQMRVCLKVSASGWQRPLQGYMPGQTGLCIYICMRVRAHLFLQDKMENLPRAILAACIVASAFHLQH